MPDLERRRFLGPSSAWRRWRSPAAGLGACCSTAGVRGCRRPPIPSAAGHGRRPARRGGAGRRRHHPAGRARMASFYRIDTNLLTPRVDAATWTLTVDGMVDHPFTLTYDELLAMPMVEQYVTIACVSNEVGGDLVGNALWQGVPAARRCSTGPGSRPAPPRWSDTPSTAGPPASRPPGSTTDGSRGAGGRGHERRSAARRARLPGAPDRARACTATCRPPSG